MFAQAGIWGQAGEPALLVPALEFLWVFAATILLIHGARVGAAK